MNQVSVDFSTTSGKMKPMHAINNGPVVAGYEQIRSNFDTFKALMIPFVRNHDASFCEDYGGEHTVDVHAIFPNFDADPEDPDSYDFFYTDQYTKQIIDAGCEVYYRLGTKIEHGKKKYGTIVPNDFKKWAVICEHIIRHYMEGWANGYHWNIRYWEIWNEPDGIGANGSQPNWSGSPEQFYELYKVASRHLKACFPHLLIGGPGMSKVNEKWMREFLQYQRADGNPSPIDFIGWHYYGVRVSYVDEITRTARRILDEEGYPDTQIHISEWNYIENWHDQYISSIETIIGIRGAAFSAAVMCTGQTAPVDMLLYYDARPSVFNGLFDMYSLRPLKGYYSFLMFSQLFQLGSCVQAQVEGEALYASASTDGNRHAAMIAHYNHDKNETVKRVQLCISGVEGKKLRYYLLDETNTMTECPLPENGEVIMQPSSVILVTDYSICD